MMRKAIHLTSGLALFFGMAGVQPTAACDVTYIKGQSGETVGFPGGRDSRIIRRYVVLGPSKSCSGMVVGWGSTIDGTLLVRRSTSNAQFPGGQPSGTVGYIIACPSTCLNHLTTRSEVIGYLTGPKDFSGYLVKGGSRAIQHFLAGCPSSAIRGFLTSRRGELANIVARSSTNNTYMVVSQSSYVRRFAAGRTGNASKQFVGGAPSRAITHPLLHPRTNARKYVVARPSSGYPGYLAGSPSKPRPEYVADTQCED